MLLLFVDMVRLQVHLVHQTFNLPPVWVLSNVQDVGALRALTADGMYTFVPFSLLIHQTFHLPQVLVLNKVAGALTAEFAILNNTAAEMCNTGFVS